VLDVVVDGTELGARMARMRSRQSISWIFAARSASVSHSSVGNKGCALEPSTGMATVLSKHKSSQKSGGSVSLRGRGWKWIKNPQVYIYLVDTSGGLCVTSGGTSGGEFSIFLSIDFYEACSNLYVGRYGALPYLPVLQKSSYVPEIVSNWKHRKIQHTHHHPTNDICHLWCCGRIQNKRQGLSAPDPTLLLSVLTMDPLQLFLLHALRNFSRSLRLAFPVANVQSRYRLN
jgi:hypothetical protein